MLLSVLGSALVFQGNPRSVRAEGSVYYLDCSAQANGDGSSTRPWNSLATVDGFRFSPGDELLLRSGTRCSGTLHPLGSGTAHAPIIVGSYGKGSRPIVDGGRHVAAVELFDQSYWKVSHLDVVGGDRYGVWVSGDKPDSHIDHIDLADLDVHGAHYVSRQRADSGEVFLSPRGAGEVLDNVEIDGVAAHDSHVSEGILVTAGGAFEGSRQKLGSHILVENSIAHDVYGDGIVVMEARHALIQNNITYNTGLCPANCGTTPNGLWEWYCHHCIVQGNESYHNHSWNQHDGGDFDIDYYNRHNIVQYNYGHDSAGYCIAFFGAGGSTTTDNIFRYNICSNNARDPRNAFQGAVFVYTWNGGSLNGVEIYNNTFYWNPAAAAPVLETVGAKYKGSLPRFFRNNIVFSTVPSFVSTTSAFRLDHNLYWSSALRAIWQYDGKTYTNLGDYQAGTHQGLGSQYANPLLAGAANHFSGLAGRPTTAFTLLPGSPARNAGVNVCLGRPACSMGGRDFWGHPLPQGGDLDIGANQAP